MTKHDWLFLIAVFLFWKVTLLIFLLLGIQFLPQAQHFLGGGREFYEKIPQLWAWANFDGEHYLSIAQNGYGNGEQAFFPFYPLLIKLVVQGSKDLYHLLLSALFLSNLGFFIGLIGLWKLARIDFNEFKSKLVIVLILLFPTSFFFGSVYTEGLFFALIVWSFYFARKRWFLLAGIIGMIAAATRIVGIALFPALFLEWWLYSRHQSIRECLPAIASILLIPFGLLFYMLYLYFTYQDPFAFVYTLTWFGEQRSSSPILLPQVFWRYIKIATTLKLDTWYTFVYVLEISTAVFLLLASIISWIKLRASYTAFLLVGYLLPTLSGSFSSLPRYILPLFPAFFCILLLMNKLSNWKRGVIIFILAVLLAISTILFTRGYFIA